METKQLKHGLNGLLPMPLEQFALFRMLAKQLNWPIEDYVLDNRYREAVSITQQVSWDRLPDARMVVLDIGLSSFEDTFRTLCGLVADGQQHASNRAFGNPTKITPEKKDGFSYNWASWKVVDFACRTTSSEEAARNSPDLACLWALVCNPLLLHHMQDEMGIGKIWLRGTRIDRKCPYLQLDRPKNAPRNLEFNLGRIRTDQDGESIVQFHAGRLW